MPFSTLPSAIAEALAKRGYEAPTAVQAEVLAQAEERDLIVSARTGSGKTVAYGLALARTLMGDEARLGPPRQPLALVIAPTRELALQVQRELAWLYEDAGGRVAACVGGMDVRREQRLLAQGCHIVVGTPGRLRDHLERGSLIADSLRAVVLDEADEMLDLGFREDLEEILDMTPAERRTLLFSATMPRPIVELARRYQRDALRLTVTSADQPHGDIDYRAVVVNPADVEHAVVNVLRFYESGVSMVFCATREAVRRLHASLVERGFAAVALSGELSQSERNHALQALRDRRARVCVATDVAARGIDLPDLGLVVHAELPNDPETLQHRSGRTGRAGRKGICVLIVPFRRRRRTEGLLRAAHVRVNWVSAPTPEEIRAGDRQRLIEALATEEPTEEDLETARALLAEHGAERLAAALVRDYRARLPEPEELFAGDFDRGPGVARGPAEPVERREPRPGFEDTLWFRVDAGRAQNAEPRWLLPYICRRGHVTKGEIGAIRVLDRETRFEVPRAIAGRFIEALQRTAGADEDLRIEPIEGGQPPMAGKGRPPRRQQGPRVYQPKPYKASKR